MMHKFRAASFPGTSRASVCWDLLQTLGKQDDQSESILYYIADCLQAVHSATGTERSHSFHHPA